MRWATRVAIALGLAGVIVWWCWPRRDAVAPAPRAAVYDVSLDQDQTTRLELGGGGDEAPLHATLGLRGRLALGPMLRDGDGWTRTLAIVDVEHWQVRLGDTELGAATRREVAGAAARMVLDDRGAVVGLDLDPAQPVVIHNLLRLLASELQLEHRDLDRWTSTEAAHAGVADVTYQRDPDGALRKVRAGYRSLRVTADPHAPVDTDAVTVVRFGADRAIDHLDARERLVAGAPSAPLATITTRLTLRRSSTRVALPSRRWRRVAVDAPLVEPELEQRALRMQIGDLTIERLLARVEAFTTAEGDREFPSFVWQATGLLTAEPALTDRLMTRLRAGELTSAQRGLIVDLLVLAGHATAQAHLRAVWRDRASFPDPDEQAWLAARLGNLKAPEAATVAALLASFDEADAPRQATRLAAGALVAVARGDAGEVADRVVARLRDDLEQADAAAPRIAALRALHNAGRRDTLDLIARAATDDAAAVRAAAVTALAKLPAADALPLLTPRLRDPAIAVQRATLTTLVHKPVDAATVDHVAQAILDGSLAPRAWRDAINLIRVAAPDRRAELVAYMAPRATDPKLRARLLALLPRE